MCAYTFSKDWFEKIECPFCNKGIIEIHHILPIKNENLSSTVGGRIFKSSHQSPEREDVQNDCPSCGAKKEAIEKKLKEGSLSKPPSRQEILKRLKDAGLPTKV